MKVVLLGGGIMARDVAIVLDVLVHQDTLVTTGATKGIVEAMLRKRGRSKALWPKLETQLLESERYDPDKARTQLAAQLVAGGASAPPHVIVLAGEPDPVLQEEVMRFAAARTPQAIPIVTAEDFKASRVSA